MRRGVDGSNWIVVGVAGLLGGCGARNHPPVIINAQLDARSDDASRSESGMPDGSDAEAGSERADVAALADGAFQPASHVPLPHLVLVNSGAVLASPQLVTITYADDSYIDEVELLGDLLVDPSWLPAVGAEYGVGAGTHLAKVRLAETAPAHVTEDEIAAMLRARFADATLPAPGGENADAVYMVYYPGGTVIQSRYAETSCVDFAGFHGSSTDNGVPFVYGVIADCGDGMNGVTAVASHELIEAATDPYVGTYSGWKLETVPSDPWWAERGTEVADLCERESGLYLGGYLAVERSWSNAGAAMDHPCLPAVADEVYFNVSPASDQIPSVAAGSTFTATLTGWSTGPTGDWTLRLAHDPGSQIDFAVMNPTLNSDTINNGGQVRLTLSVPATAAVHSLGAVRVYSNRRRYWPVAFRVE